LGLHEFEGLDLEFLARDDVEREAAIGAPEDEIAAGEHFGAAMGAAGADGDLFDPEAGAGGGGAGGEGLEGEFEGFGDDAGEVANLDGDGGDGGCATAGGFAFSDVEDFSGYSGFVH
jgi:hypothetical protein